MYSRVAGDVLLASVDCIWAYGMCFSKWCELCLGLWILLEFCSGLCGLNPFWMVWSVSQWQKPAEIGGQGQAGMSLAWGKVTVQWTESREKYISAARQNTHPFWLVCPVPKW